MEADMLLTMIEEIAISCGIAGRKSCARPSDGFILCSRGQKQPQRRPRSGPAGEPNERRDPANSYVCRKVEDLCRDIVPHLPSPGLLESRPGRSTPHRFGRGRERSS
jgi:hypothetical protein